jgi:transcription-repair coupling factor (superfamily II helicase)
MGILREELEDRFGEIPEPLSNLIQLQIARIKLGQAGATAVSFKAGRLVVTPMELDSTRAKALRAEIPEVLYESGKSQLSARVAGGPAEQFDAVVRVADALLAVLRGSEDDDVAGADAGGDEDERATGDLVARAS